MSRMHYLRAADNGEPSMWWSWQDLRNRDKRSGFCTHGRAWFNWSRNSIGAEWHLFSQCCHASITFSSTGDDNISIALSIPFLVALYFHLTRALWVKRLPGVRYVSGDYDSGEREIRIAVHDNAVWWTFWVNDRGMRSSNWRDGCFHIDDFFWGRNKYSETERQSHDTFLVMPEGVYPVTVELFVSTWKRPRWPFPQSVARANVEIEGGVPVPGDGENSWDMDDDAIFGGTYPALTVDDALSAIRESIMHTRRRNGGEHWAPADGWSAHCVTR